MRKSAVLIGSVLGLSLLVAACASGAGPHDDGNYVGLPGSDGGSIGEGDGSPDAGAGGGLPLELACLTLNGQRCDYLQRCGLIAPGEASHGDCMDLLGATACGPTLWPARVKKGTLSYHAGSALQCADDYLTRACESWREQPAACGEITSAAVALGGKCYGGGPTECRSGTCTGGTCPRICREPGGPGELCEVDADCRAAHYCKPLVSGRGVGSCTAVGTSRAACAGDAQCVDGHFCNWLQRCERYAVEGESCQQSTCAAAYWCNASAGRVCSPRVEAGGSCSTDAQCLSALRCDPESKTCASPGPVVTRAEGDPCTVALECAEPLTCVPGADGGSCGPRQDEGAACTSDRDCSLFSRCVDATCTRLPRPGEPCAALGCLYGTCELTGDAWTCRGQGGPNAACSADAQCASGRCVAGACLAACSP